MHVPLMNFQYFHLIHWRISPAGRDGRGLGVLTRSTHHLMILYGFLVKQLKYYL